MAIYYLPSGKWLHSELENHQFNWEIHYFYGQFSVAMLVYWRVSMIHDGEWFHDGSLRIDDKTFNKWLLESC